MTKNEEEDYCSSSIGVRITPDKERGLVVSEIYYNT